MLQRHVVHGPADRHRCPVGGFDLVGVGAARLLGHEPRHRAPGLTCAGARACRWLRLTVPLVWWPGRDEVRTSASVEPPPPSPTRARPRAGGGNESCGPSGGLLISRRWPISGGDYEEMERCPPRHDRDTDWPDRRNGRCKLRVARASRFGQCVVVSAIARIDPNGPRSRLARTVRHRPAAGVVSQPASHPAPTK